MKQSGPPIPLSIALLACVVRVVLAAAPAPAEIETRVVRVTETRHKMFVENGNGRSEDEVEIVYSLFTQGRSMLQLSLELSGPEIERTVKYGNLKVTKARDDTGAALAHDRSSGLVDISSKMVPVRSASSLGLGSKRRPDVLNVDVSLGLPTRKASRLTTLEGSIDLQVGALGKTTVPAVRSRTKEAVKDDVLKRAGVSVTVAPEAPKDAFVEIGAPEKAVRFAFSGPAGALADYRLVTAKGAAIAGGRSTNQDGKTTYVELTAHGDLPEDAGLELTVLTSSRIVTVPYKLKDIELP